MPIAEQLNFDVLAPEDYNKEIINENTLTVFSPLVLDFIEEIAGKILSNSYYKNYPQIMAVAFWMRRPNLLKLKEKFEKQKNKVRVGRGVVFHITPSNVDTIFIYSWFLSMLVGNVNVLKVSRKQSRQVELLLKEINKVAGRDKYKPIRNRFLIIRYDNEKEITSYFSSYCNLRVIWGGDMTINAVRSIPLPPLSKEITFPDRFSYTVIDAREFLFHNKQEKLAGDFLKEAYSFDQNACSSPRVVFWLGEKEDCDRAREVFWSEIKELITDFDIRFSPSNIMDKFVVENSLAIDAEDIKIERTNTNLINRILFENIEDIDREAHTGGGLFYEYICDSLDSLSSFIFKKDQTLSYFGLERKDILEFIENKQPKGINRIVPIGKAIDFSVTWDGYDLLYEFCREIEIL